MMRSRGRFWRWRRALRRWTRGATGLAVGGALLLAGGPLPSAGAAPATPPPLPLLVFAGQSNMTGWITDVDDLSAEQQQTQAGVLFFGPNEKGSTWAALTPPTVYTNGLTLANPAFHKGFGPEVSTGLQLLNFPGYGLVAEVKYAEPGTDLNFWWKPGNATYNRMLTRVSAAKGALQGAYPDRTVYIAGFFWMQGESDAISTTLASQYQANLTNFIGQVRDDFGDASLPFVLGQILDGHHEAGVVRAAQAQVAASVPNVRLVTTDDLPHETQEGIHFTSAGIYGLGERFGAAFALLAIQTQRVYLPLARR
ncbi:MAG: hypothetical protein IT317_12420 [Anaerolineales bacterium]|nr:hypothetical protein [Anaerolineales bacterium]